MTDAGLMDCKKALQESNGDLETAVDILRKKGAASAAKKAGRSANEGLIIQFIQPGARAGILVEVNCETDFVARNEQFLEFCNDVAKTLLADPKSDLETKRTAAVAKLGENIQISRHHILEVSGNGMVAAYIHTGGKVGVLVEVGAGKEATIDNDEFKQLVKDTTLQIAAGHPYAVSREHIEASVIEKEKEIATGQAQGKPPQAVEKIVQGKLEKFYQTYCLVDQGFVKRNSEVTLKEHITEISKKLGDEITVRRFVRFQIGESVS
jgi:elongation factor Ts